MANEPGLARDSTLAFIKGVVDVDLALPVFVDYRSSSGAIRLWRTSGGDPFFLAIGERTRFVLGQGDIPLHPLSEYRVQRNRVAEVEDDYGTNPTHEPTEARR